MAAEIQQSTVNPDYTTVKLTKRFDATISDEIEGILKNLCESKKYDIIIDFKDSNYLSSMGLRVLFSISRILSEQNKKLNIVNAGSTVLKVIKIADCSSLFNIYENEEKMAEDIK